MNNLAILPIILPLLASVIVAFIPKKLNIVRKLSQIFTVVFLIIVGYIFWKVFANGPITLQGGGWDAPFGITFIADYLSILLVLTTYIIATAAVFYAPYSLSDKQEMFYFYTFFFLLISGISGAFLTGDLFNLFVFFEVLLMASYGLIVLGNGKVQLRESLKYVLINVFSSMLFVTTVAFIYSLVGTLNMAHIAERVEAVPAEQQGILTAVGILLFFVFAVKAAIFPLYYWLPNSYVVPNPVVSALFGALLTKVGIYSIFRVYTLIFVQDTGITHQLFIWLAMLTMIFGVIGALSTNNVKLIITYNIIPAIGFILMGIGLYSEEGLAGSTYYLIHDMIIKAALFLLIGALVVAAGTKDLSKMSGVIQRFPLLGWLFFIGSLVLAGIPPFSGFIGKLLLLQGSLGQGEVLLTIIALLSSLLILLSMMRIFVRGFWGEKMEGMTTNPRKVHALTIPAVFLIALSIFLGVCAEYVLPYVETISNYLLDRTEYISSVLKG
ncbi:Na+/H+ antiporter subunit D [Tenuibacillus multivorans]|uniref:Multicomponent Na+:H+ antiporter subunit D n=1 Tax=Tenuibacillus multivorans TaxID=237069 RepID=A0A1G9ZGE7_9BACI|nr:Na+/H+ antiporter subunit D [Tenuibacillus multivorans]GEL77513.1 Na(+)/H(+) antiporter subunit D [Tenuibacillus multivorans]SDN20379.1 multicomponent Na+:H+ antiporter subunit D [Tenuibacillus multivorans]